MIKTLHTFVTVVAVHCVLGSKILAVDTDVVQMKLFIHESLHQAKKVFLEWNIPWIYQSHTVEYDCQWKEGCVKNDGGFLLRLLWISDSHTLVVAGRNHEERHVDHIKEKHDNLCRGRPFHFLDRPCESEAFASAWRWQHILHLLEMARLQHPRVTLR